MAKNERALAVKAEGYDVRAEKFQDRDHLVIPVVALVEDVVFAMNATSPELVTLEEFGKAPFGWNGRPLFLGHPMIDGHPVFGNTPGLLEREAIGTVFNASIKDRKLVMEAWVDSEKAPKSLLSRIEGRESIEISVGVFAETDDVPGKFAGKEYVGRWSNIVPDHLALLPEGALGACSIDMGCGVRAAKKGEQDVSEKKNLMTRVMEAIRAALPASKMSDNDLRRKLYEAVSAVDPRVGYVEAVYEKYFVYYNYEAGGNGVGFYKRDYKVGKDGEVTIGEKPTEVEPILTYEPTVLEEQPKVAESAATGAPCSCKHADAPQENRTMSEKKTRVTNLITKLSGLFTAADQAFLEAASDEQLARFEGFTPAPAPVVKEKKEEAKVAEAKVVETTAKVEAKAEQTEEQYLASAPAAIREAIQEGLRVGREKKAAAVKTLRESGRCDMTEKELQAKSQAELDQLVKLANVKVAVDYSGQGAPKTENTPTEPPAPADLTAAIKARRG